MAPSPCTGRSHRPAERHTGKSTGVRNAHFNGEQNRGADPGSASDGATRQVAANSDLEKFHMQKQKQFASAAYNCSFLSRGQGAGSTPVKCEYFSLF